MTADGSPSRTPRAVLALGAAIFLLGAGAALRTLPEWRPFGLDTDVVRASLEAARAEAEALGGTFTKPALVFGADEYQSAGYDEAFASLGPLAASYVGAAGLAPPRRVTGTLLVPEIGTGPGAFGFGGDGAIRHVRFFYGESLFSILKPDARRDAAMEAFARRIRERVGGGPVHEVVGGVNASGASFRLFARTSPVSGPPETVLELRAANGFATWSRNLARVNERVLDRGDRWLQGFWSRGGPGVLFFLLVVVLFVVLLARRRLGFRNGLAIGVLALASMLVGGLVPRDQESGLVVAYAATAGRVAAAAYLAVLWAIAESLLRESVPGFTTSLDALTAGRLGPRAGRSLLAGLGLGAVAAGLSLATHAGAVALGVRGVHPTAPSFGAALFQGMHTPFYEGPAAAAAFVVAVALLRFVFPRRVADPLGAVLFALYAARFFSLAPWLLAFALSLAVAAVFLVALQRYGLASLLVAATAAPLFLATLAGWHLQALGGGPFLAGAFSVLALAALGVVGVRRSRREDEARFDAPTYVKRLEDERRLHHEMNLLSRMQLSLLPEKPPALAGWDLSVKTVLATEAGGDLYDFLFDETGALWIAAGDVAGHGYSCGIQQAMVKAALVSSVSAASSPAEVLAKVDRVLRVAGKTRLFTTLALFRLDLATGTGVLSSAAHPPPLRLVDGAAAELSQPGLPLGQGPDRVYGEATVELPRNACLVFASDGLFEGLDRFEEPYGYDRPRAVLESIGLWRKASDAIVDALFADWRRHVGQGAPADDTTILVVKRTG